MNNEQDWDVLSDEKELSKRRALAEQEFADLGSSEISYLRKRAKSDLFFLCTAILEYDLLSVKLHKHFTKWLEATRRYKHRLELMPRNHYKTTIGTISESIQIALPNDGGIVTEYPWTLGPDVKLLIAHENETGASRYLFEIAEAFLAKPLMLALFPECIPSNRKQRINKRELELPRTRHHKEPTFDVLGVGGAAQGRHYHRVELDDIVGEDARDSDTVMKRVVNWFDNIGSLLTRPKIDGWDLRGTRWHLYDVYSHAMQKYGIDMDVSVLNAVDQNREKVIPGQMAAYVRAAIENGEIIFPEEFDEDFYSHIRKNRKVWSAQYANNPLDEGLTEFNAGWLKFYNRAPNGDIIIFGGDGRAARRVRVWDLDRVVFIDPSVGEDKTSDESGIVVTGTDVQNNVYILETIKKRLRPPELIDTMFDLYSRWNPRVISIEEVNFSATYRYWFERECSRIGVHPTIFPHKEAASKKMKPARVRALSTYGAAGQLYCLEGMHELREEWERFGVIEKYHLLDALAQGPSVWKKGLGEEDWRGLRNAEDRVLRRRSVVTGY